MQTDHHMARMSPPEPLNAERIAMFRREAGLGVCSDPRREFGRDYRILELLDALDDRGARLEALADEWEGLGLPTAAGELRAAFRAALHPVQGDEFIQEPPC